MNNTTQQNETKRNVVSSLHLLKEHLYQSKLRSLSINYESLSKLKSFKKRFSHSNRAINSSSSQDDKNKRIKDLEFTAKNDNELRSVDSLRDTFVFSDGNVESELMFIGEAPGYE